MRTSKLRSKSIWAYACSLLLLVAFSLYSIPETLSAHGTEIGYSIQSTVVVQANFATGEPMADAQITVYAPDNPAEAWLQGTADENGTFSFIPDPDQTGSYDVRVRSAGHGEILTVDVAGGGSAGGQSTLMQQIIMAAAIIWGLIGTALFYSSRNPAAKPEGEQEYAHS